MLKDFLGSPYNFLVWIFSPDRRVMGRSFMGEDEGMGDLLDSGSKTEGSTKNTPEHGFSKKPSSPYTGPSKPSKFPKKARESGKWPFKNESRRGKRSLKALMDAECDRCSDCVRKCEVIECPLWQFRTKACKVHRGYFEKLRKSETLSDKELGEIQKLYETEDRAMRHVFVKVQQHCPSKLRTFIAAYNGKSRASAIKAYEVWMANYDLTMVEPLEGRNQP
jgi:hypothetical protein